jgi:hypothetical protein
MKKIIPLHFKVIQEHNQMYEQSCVPMSVEFIVKLVDPSKIPYYDEQHRYPDGKCWGKNFDNKKINNITFHHWFFGDRHTYLLDPLFVKMKEELDNNRYVQLSLVSEWKTDSFGTFLLDGQGHKIPNCFHCWVVFQYDETGEFHGVTKYFNNRQPKQPSYTFTIREQLIEMGGTDILTYR